MTALGIFFISLAALMLEVVLARLLSIAHGENLAYFVISLALLGYGFATPLLCRSKRLAKIESFVWPLSFSLTAPLSLYFAHFITMDAARLAWEIAPWMKVGILYFLFGVPFLFAGLTIASVFMEKTKKSHRIYAGDLIGAGLGAILACFFAPLNAYFLTPLFAAISAFCLTTQKKYRALSLAVLLLASAAALLNPDWEPPFSPSRGLPTALLDPDAKRIQTRWSAWTRVDQFTGAAARVAPGLSLNYLGDLPEPKGFAIDGDQIIPTASSEDKDFLDHLPHALSYQLVENPSVLLIQSHGGLELSEALVQKAQKIILVENDSLFEKMETPKPGVRWSVAPVRAFLHASPPSYDLISVGGLGAAREDFLLTQESLKLMFSRLTPRGILTIHLYRLPPPRLELRLLNTLIETLKETMPMEYKQHLMITRTLQTYSFLIAKNPWRMDQYLRAENFVSDKGFEWVFPSPQDFADPEIALFNHLIEGKKPDYPFLIAPMTDNLPYPYQSLQFKSLKKVIHMAKGRWQMILEGGGLGWAVLLQTVIGSVLILLTAWSADLKSQRRKYPCFDLYFLAIGFGFIFMEMSWLGRVAVLLSHPAQAVPLVLGSILAGAGIGSGLSEKKSPMFACLLCAAIALCLAFATPFLFSLLEKLSFPHAGVAFLIIVLSLPLGVPFPSALSFIEEKSVHVPWLWGLNACASVCGAVLASTLLPLFGFKIIFSLGALFYLLACWALLRSHRLFE